MIRSALGLLYLFAKTAPRKTVKVWTSKCQTWARVTEAFDLHRELLHLMELSRFWSDPQRGQIIAESHAMDKLSTKIELGFLSSHLPANLEDHLVWVVRAFGGDWVYRVSGGRTPARNPQSRQQFHCSIPLSLDDWAFTRSPHLEQIVVKLSNLWLKRNGTSLLGQRRCFHAQKDAAGWALWLMNRFKQRAYITKHSYLGFRDIGVFFMLTIQCCDDWGRI